MKRAAVVATLLSLAFGCSDPKCADGLTCKAGGESGSAGAGHSSGGSSSNGGNVSDGGNVSSGGSSSDGGNVNSGGSVSSGGNATGGKGMIECPPECFVAVTCVKECGGTPVSVGCCPCVSPAFNANTCNK